MHQVAIPQLGAEPPFEAPAAALPNSPSVSLVHDRKSYGLPIFVLRRIVQRVLTGPAERDWP
jgi:hypothetical protein